MASNNADFACTFFVRQANGQPYDLTGATLEMSVKNKPGARPGRAPGGQLMRGLRRRRQSIVSRSRRPRR
jgi:hypothetical protein